jgi:hypothetical protein
LASLPVTLVTTLARTVLLKCVVRGAVDALQRELESPSPQSFHLVYPPQQFGPPCLPTRRKVMSGQLIHWGCQTTHAHKFSTVRGPGLPA